LRLSAAYAATTSAAGVMLIKNVFAPIKLGCRHWGNASIGYSLR
jgi:hypothetical protein